MSEAFLYKWTQKSTGMWYVGSRTAKGCHLNDGYLCSSKTVKPMILENKNNWIREILSVGESTYISNLESRFLKKIDAKHNPLSYNRSNSGKVVTSGMVRMHKSKTNIFVNKCDTDFYLTAGWKLGFSKSVKTKMKENHADVSGKRNPMAGTSRSGPENPFFNKTHTAESILKMQKPCTAIQKQNMSLVKQGDKNPMFGKTQKRICCEFCSKEVAVNGYARWHGNNCKLAIRSKDLKI